MSLSNRDRVGRALDLLQDGLGPFLEREMEATYGKRWKYQAVDSLREHHFTEDGQDLRLDVQALLLIMWDQWNQVFKKTLGHAERNYVSELREARNKWAHQEQFSTQAAQRVIDTIQLLLKAISATEQEEEAERQKMELLRIFFEEKARNVKRRNTGPLVEGAQAKKLTPWREVIAPHPDVASGNFQYAEFAADLSQVYRGIASEEYKDPYAFFKRTFLTNGLRQLLLGALRRLSGQGGDPIVELQTNFGGGKTHSLLALYHLFSAKQSANLPGVDQLLHEVGLTQAPAAQRAVLVGHALSPARTEHKPDGCEIHTIWGEMAWQLLKKEGYAMVAQEDRSGISPGSEVLRQLFLAAGPSLVLIDEWVVLVRQLYHKTEQPAGSFEANLSFAQNLTEAAKATPNVLIVATIPASETETGGEGGQEAAIRLKQIFGRVESPWRPADVQEGFEIVRRRLFEPIAAHLYPVRDAVASTFSEYYRSNRQEFPDACSEASYQQRIRDGYPIHPELFDRLFTDWSSIDKFQRTRGVLRLLASVIHELWVQQDQSALILPAMIPLDSDRVQSIFTQYLEDNWVPIIEKDVDGNQSLPRMIDRSNTSFGRYSAARRVARTIFFGSTPTLRSANKGLQDIHIKLGCAQPDDTVATYGDALRRLTEQATYLYQQNRRYWYDTQASVTRLAQDRATQYDDESVYETMKEYLKPEQKTKGDFASVHICPESGSEVLDENSGLRLVVLKPHYPHAHRDANSAAMIEASKLLAFRGSSPRRYRNTLIFLAADRTRIEELKQAARLFKAWDSIYEDREALNLDAFQNKQVSQRRNEARDRIIALVPETYHRLLIPSQPEPRSPDFLQEHKLQPQRGQGLLANNVSSTLRMEEGLITKLAGVRLCLELDRIPLWRGDHVLIKDLVEDFARYVYLLRLKHPDVMLEALRDGIQSPHWQRETFAYAEGWDQEQQRYIGLRTGPATFAQFALASTSPQDEKDEEQGWQRYRKQYEAGSHFSITATGQALLVKSEVADAQIRTEISEKLHKERLEREARQKEREHRESGREPVPPGPAPVPGSVRDERAGYPPVPPTPQAPKIQRYNGSVRINERMMGSEAGKIMEEVVKHLTGLTGSKVKVTIEIEAELPENVSDAVLRTVKENSNTLRFQISEFHTEE